MTTESPTLGAAARRAAPTLAPRARSLSLSLSKFSLAAAGAALLTASACTGGAPPSVPDPPTGPAARAPTPIEPSASSLPPPSSAVPALEGLDELGALDELDRPGVWGGAPAVRVSEAGDVASLGCVATASPVRVHDGADRMAIVRAGSAYLIAAYARTPTGEAVAIARLDEHTRASIVTTLTIEAPVADGSRRAAPALALAADGRLLVAATNASGALLFGDVELTSEATADALRIVVSDAHADARFAPAIVPAAGATAIAWTDGSGTPMRVRLVRVDRLGAALGAPLDVTPDAGGAAAPTVGPGASTPTLFFVDPRVSISVVSRVTLGADATPGATEVVRPLARAANPASFVVVGHGEATRIAYVAVGTSGSRAVGLLLATGSEPPVPVVSGLGFGEAINVDGASLGSGSVLAAEAPTAAAPDAPHEVRVRALSDDGRLSDALILEGATNPAIAAGPDGNAAVATSGGYVTRLRCRAE